MKAYAVPFEKFVNLADARLGTKIISVTDDWFADANRLFQPTPAVWKEGVFDDNGKWMDGWESRRPRRARRGPMSMETGTKAMSRYWGRAAMPCGWARASLTAAGGSRACLRISTCMRIG